MPAPVSDSAELAHPLVSFFFRFPASISRNRLHNSRSSESSQRGERALASLSPSIYTIARIRLYLDTRYNAMDGSIGLLDSQHYENCRVSNVGYAGLRDCTAAGLETSHHTLIYPLPFDNKFSPRDIVPVMTYANRA